MGWRLKIYFRCAFCTLVLLPIYGSREPLSYFLGEPFKQSHVLPIARRMVLQTASGTPSTGTDTRLEPSGVLATSSHASNGPVKLGFDVFSSLEISPVLAQVKERATIITYPVGSQYAPSPITPHKGSSSQPPITLPHKFEAVAPTIQPAIPPMPTSAPSDHFGVEYKHPTTISPSIKSHAPEVSGDLSPSSTIPPLAQSSKEMPGDGGKAPKSNSPLTAPRTPVSSPPVKIAPNQPNAPPDITKIAPSMIVPALPPPSGTPPTIPAKRYGVPVAAPPMGISKPLSPMNDSHRKAESPLNPAHTPLISHTPPLNERLPYSPAPHEAQKPSNTTQAPLVSHSQPPEGRTVHSLAPPPTISIHQRTSRKAGGSPLIAPSSSAPLPPQLQPPPTGRIPRNPAPAPLVSNHQQISSRGVRNLASPPSSPSPPSPYHPGPVLSPSLHPPEAFPKNSRRHHAPPPHIQGSLLSPAKAPFSSNHSEVLPVSSPSPMIPSRRHEWSHSPILSPSGSFSWNPRAPAPQVITPLPPPPSNLGSLLSPAKAPFSSNHSEVAPVSSPSPMIPSRRHEWSHSPILSPSGSFSWNPRAPAPQVITPLPPPPSNLGSLLSPAKAPFSSNHSEVAPVSSPSPMIPSRRHEWSHSPILSPSGSFSWNPRAPAPQVITPLPPPPSNLGSLLSPAKAPFSSNHSEVAPVSSPSPMIPSRRHEWSHSPILSPSGSFSWNPRAPAPQIITPLPPPPSNLGPSHSPMLSPSGSFSRNPRTPEPQPVRTLPPPPPNLDCTSFVCVEPLTSTPPGSPCNCVLPIKVGLRLSIALYTFFPLVSELAQEIASGVYMRQSQVRIMGANAADEEPEKTIVLLDLVPLGHTFNNTTAFLTYEKFWHKQIPIKASAFGDYNILYVLYPGLPPSPPTAPNAGDGTFGNGNNGMTIKPLGVDVPKRKDKLNISLIVTILLSSIVALVLVGGAAWLLLLRHGNHTCLHISTPQTLLPSFAKSSVAGSRATIFGSQHSSASASFSPNIATFMGLAKIFTLAEIETATKKFDDSRIIGEGGFGRVYEGILEDGTGVAVKVLKRDDQRGVREFLVEVEMLSRLHHRNLVKLTGICTEDIRCLVYELIPNGSVESHLHGVDKGTAPLDWSARTKIALGAARGLAYLHEDSSPRVIHRDFKSSNILLEHDYTPKISDFGLARTALDEGNEHISTQVMGTFGYVAPEYAMTGHLLVKSDVYSYGVVLLELLTGRKPVDMLKPPGQENLVAWAHPLLTNKEGLEIIIDSALGTNYPCGSVAKVAAIASMCVQPEASHRPFMGEVVQALKLVCNEGDDYSGSGSCSQDYSCAQDTERRISVGLGMESGRMLLGSDIFSTSARFSRDTCDSFQRHSSSGPLTTGKNRQFWQRDGGLSTGSMSEHGLSLKSRIGLEGGEEWP